MSNLKDELTNKVTETWADVVKKTMPGVPVILTPTGSGSGIVVREDGLILTNKHVVSDGKVARLRFKNGEYPAVVIKESEKFDLAILKTYGSPEELKSIFVFDTAEADSGSEILVLGHPRGFEQTVTRGIISAYRDLKVLDMPSQRYLQVDAAINGGNSGGPIINKHGKAVGVSTFVWRDNESLGFGVPAVSAQQFLDQTFEEVDSVVIKMPTEKDVASLGFDPDPLKSLQAYFVELPLKVDELDREKCDSKNHYSWKLKTPTSEDIIVDYIDPNEDMPLGKLVFTLTVVPEPSQTFLRSVHVLQSLLTYNATTNRAKFAIDDSGRVDLIISRNAEGLDPVEIIYCVDEMIEEAEKLGTVVTNLREYGAKPFTLGQLGDFLP